MSVRKIFVYGDSISMQYGFHLKEILERQGYGYDRKGGGNSLDLANPVWNGQSSVEMLCWIERQTRREEILLFNCGLHDIVHTDIQKPCRVSVGDYRSNLERICKKAAELFAGRIFVNTTPVDDHRRSKSGEWVRFNRDVILYNQTAGEVMDHYQIPVIDLYTYTETLKRKMDIYQDQVHMASEASKLQAELIVKKMRERGILDA